MTLEQQHAILDKTYKQLTEFCGKRPRGSVAPWWEASKEMAELMLKYGIEYGLWSNNSPVQVQIPQYRSENIDGLHQTTRSLTMIAFRTTFALGTNGHRSTTINILRIG